MENGPILHCVDGPSPRPPEPREDLTEPSPQRWRWWKPERLRAALSPGYTAGAWGRAIVGDHEAFAQRWRAVDECGVVDPPARKAAMSRVITAGSMPGWSRRTTITASASAQARRPARSEAAMPEAPRLRAGRGDPLSRLPAARPQEHTAVWSCPLAFRAGEGGVGGALRAGLWLLAQPGG